MLKVIVIGSCGAGKSTFSKKLAEYTNLPLYHLDMIWNNDDKTTISRDEFDDKLEQIFKSDKWIMDGNYQRTLERRLQECDTVFLLDYPLEVCLLGAQSRVGIERDDLPWIEENLNEEIKQKIMRFPQEKLPEIYRFLNKYQEDKDIIIFKSREDAENYIKSISL